MKTCAFRPEDIDAIVIVDLYCLVFSHSVLTPASHYVVQKDVNANAKHRAARASTVQHFISEDSRKAHLVLLAKVKERRINEPERD